MSNAIDLPPLSPDVSHPSHRCLRYLVHYTISGVVAVLELDDEAVLLVTLFRGFYPFACFYSDATRFFCFDRHRHHALMRKTKTLFVALEYLCSGLGWSMRREKEFLRVVSARHV